MGSAADALKKMAGGMPGKDKTETKTKTKKSNGQSGAAKPAKAAAKKSPKKSPKKAPAKKAAPKKAAPKKQVKTKTKAGKTPKKAATKTKKAPTRRADLPGVTKAAERVYRRDKNGDGLTPDERKIMTIIEKNGGEMSIANIAAKLFRRKVDDIPREGVDSFRTVRNGIRKPLEYGLLLRSKTERAVVKLSAAYKKSGLKAAERYMERLRKESGKAAPKKETKAEPKPKPKKETKAGAPAKGKKAKSPAKAKPKTQVKKGTKAKGGKKSPKRSPKK